MTNIHSTTPSIRPLAPIHADACESIARALPDWFGIEEGLQDLRRSVEMQTGFIAAIDSDLVGFVTLEQHFPESWEITWMAVHPDHHRRGVGRLLIEAANDHCREHDAHHLLVKTLADSHPSLEYAQTRAFYRSMGFERLQVFPDLWGSHNPCLLMVHTLIRR